MLEEYLRDLGMDIGTYKPKLAAFLLIVSLTASSLIMIESASAQSIPKPSIPEFTLKLVEHLYDLPPVYEIDQFTGKNVTVREGAHYQWQTLDFIIENQQVPSESHLSLIFDIKGNLQAIGPTFIMEILMQGHNLGNIAQYHLCFLVKLPVLKESYVFLQVLR
jgi:hypothetical protein